MLSALVVALKKFVGNPDTVKALIFPKLSKYVHPQNLSLGRLYVTNLPIRLMCPMSICLSVRPHFRFRTLTQKRFV